ncbi:hypothetical protein [Paracidovorax anthurii]|uniref:hypothetical protein n=1 Tax=Paracidovorax anthurii TaxID=78229 RepID=UPI0011BD611E|nr:hypothetical protein [Paracidovorax anthurii]
MDTLIDALKSVVAVIAVAAPVFKHVPLRRDQAPSLAEQHVKLKQFFDEGGTDRHPMLVESAFSAAMDHQKLDAAEIRFMVRQPNPSRFIKSYLRVRGYININPEGTGLDLKSPASNPKLRKLFSWVGLSAYFVLACSAFWLLCYETPLLLLHGDWVKSINTAVVAFAFGATGLFLLYESSRLQTAAQLHERQHRLPTPH